MAIEGIKLKNQGCSQFLLGRRGLRASFDLGCLRFFLPVFVFFSIVRDINSEGQGESGKHEYAFG